MRVREIDKAILLKIGLRIKNLRVGAGFHSQETFSYACGIPRAQYARYEKGSNITILTLQKIIRFHKLTWNEFFEDDMN